MKELIEKVKQWGIDKGLDKAGHLEQAKHTLKETAKLLYVYADKDTDAVNSVIGDILVTLIISASSDDYLYRCVSRLLLEIEDYEYSLTFDVAYKSLCYHVISLENGTEKADYKLYKSTVHALNRCLSWANVNYKQSLSIKDCLQVAYNNGHFIKDK